MISMSDTPHGASVFHDPLAFVTSTRLTGLALAPDRSRLVASTLTIDAAGARYVPGLCELDPTGREPARPVAGSVAGDFAPAWAHDGRLLLLSGRPDDSEPEQKPEQKPEARADECVRLWALSEQGDATVVARHPGGISGFAAAAGSAAVGYTAALRPGASDAAAHAQLRRERQEAGVSAVLYEAGPVRLAAGESAAEQPHTFVRHPDGTVLDAGSQGPADPGDLTLSRDGRLLAYTRTVAGEVPGEIDSVAVVADAATGRELRILSRPGHQYCRPAFTADATALVCQRQREETYHHPWAVTLVSFDLTTGQETDPLTEFDNWPWPGGPVTAPLPGDATVWFTGDERGHCPVFRRDPDGTVTRLTASGAYSSLCVAPDGTALYALRAAPDSPPRAVRLDAAEPDQRPVPLDALGDLGPLPGTLTEVSCQADDGFPLRAWLVLPSGASAGTPVPMVVAPHGGPQMSWSTWFWGCNPWPFAARGYAVLLPDPALSTGYGQRMQERGLGQWGGRPYHDVLALTDAAQARADIDASRTGVVGASYGGYLANRIATRTDRFQAVVSHAGPWNLEVCDAESELYPSSLRSLGSPQAQSERYRDNSPHLDAARVSTPMLVVHGGQDRSVPVGQAVVLFQELQRLGASARFLYFPDEGHVIRRPNNLRLWFRTVLNFLDHHVLGQEWQRPPLL